jgi:transaldolase / glucose-6-phosphate isomerase
VSYTEWQDYESAHRRYMGQRETTTPLADLRKQGQSIWLDYIRRELITGGGLKRLVREDGLTGVTSNPSIFEKVR